MAQQSTKAVLASVAGAAGITTVKFIAAVLSGSAAMMAEGIHSLIDTANNLLLYLGLRRSQKPPDEHHPFGYGMELYFWTLIVAVVMVAVGGCVTILEGIYRIIKPEELTDLKWTYIALGISAGFDLFSWWMALREFRAGMGNRGVMQALRKVKDPTVISVLFEDSASLVGLALAFLCIFLGSQFHIQSLDGIGSVLIGLLLGTVAVGLIYQSKTLLIGESANDEVQASIRSLIERDEQILGIDDLLTMQLSPKDVLLNVKIRFDEALNARQVGEAVDRLEHTLREKHPEIQRIYIEAGRTDDQNSSTNGSSRPMPGDTPSRPRGESVSLPR